MDSILADTSKNTPALDAIMKESAPRAEPLLQSLYTSRLFQPYLLMENADRKVISGLEKALHSDNPVEVEDAKITATLLEILRHEEDGVEVEVE